MLNFYSFSVYFIPNVLYLHQIWNFYSEFDAKLRLVSAAKLQKKSRIQNKKTKILKYDE